MYLKKGDTVKILSGKDSGKRGKVLKIDVEGNKVIIDGVNVYKKHVRPKKQGEKGEIISLPRPLNASNVQIICGSCDRSVRVGFKIDNDKKVRYCKKCEALL